MLNRFPRWATGEGRDMGGLEIKCRVSNINTVMLAEWDFQAEMWSRPVGTWLWVLEDKRGKMYVSGGCQDRWCNGKGCDCLGFLPEWWSQGSPLPWQLDSSRKWAPRTFVYLQLIQVVQQKPTQHCKAIIFQIKVNLEKLLKRNMTILWQVIAGSPVCNVMLERDHLGLHVGYTISLGIAIYLVLFFFT